MHEKLHTLKNVSDKNDSYETRGACIAPQAWFFCNDEEKILISI